MIGNTSRNRPLDFKELIGMPDDANVEGVQRKTLLWEVELV
jgi:hypothetical protein